MTRADKIALRRFIRDGEPRSDERLAELCDCTVGTVRKYRKALAK